MRKLAVVLALASTALATPAFARDDAWYVGIEGGAMLVEDMDFDIGTTPRAATVDSEYGWDVDGIIGYDFGPFRAEAEVGYKQADVDSYISGVRTPAFTGAGGLTSVPTGVYGLTNSAKTSALSFMVNGLLDFGDDTAISGFVGGGVGVARVKAQDYGVNGNGSFLDDSDTVFAWQAIAGVRAPLTENVDIGVKYRFFNADNVRLNDIAGSDYETRFRSHSLLASVIYNFGAPTPPPPPVVETPPPPPPAPEPVVAAPVCTPGPYIVFFEWDKSAITPEAASILDNAVSAYQSCGNAQVMLAGYTDTSGSTSYNAGLSQRRADAVRSYFETKGIGGGNVTTQAFGETNLRVETADGVRELQNRRVEITYGPGSGN